MVLIKEACIFNDTYEDVMAVANLTESQKYWFCFLNLDFSLANLEITHLVITTWDPYRNYLTAKKYCGLKGSMKLLLELLQTLLKMINSLLHYITI